MKKFCCLDGFSVGYVSLGKEMSLQDKLVSLMSISIYIYIFLYIHIYKCIPSRVYSVLFWFK